MPDGPVIISPDGLFPSLYREVTRLRALAWSLVLHSGSRGGSEACQAPCGAECRCSASAPGRLSGSTDPLAPAMPAGDPAAPPRVQDPVPRGHPLALPPGLEPVLRRVWEPGYGRDLVPGRGRPTLPNLHHQPQGCAGAGTGIRPGLGGLHAMVEVASLCLPELRDDPRHISQWLPRGTAHGCSCHSSVTVHASVILSDPLPPTQPSHQASSGRPPRWCAPPPGPPFLP